MREVTQPNSSYDDQCEAHVRPESSGDFETGETGDAGGIDPVKVWLGYAAPISLGWLTNFLLLP